MILSLMCWIIRFIAGSSYLDDEPIKKDLTESF